MALPSFTVGKIRVSDLDGIVSFLPRIVRVTSDQALATSSTTLQDVTELVLPVSANRDYDGWLQLVYILSSGSTEDIKVGFNFPTGSTLHFGGPGAATSLGTGTGQATETEFGMRLSATAASTSYPYGATTVNIEVPIMFSLEVGSTAGNLQVMAAQNTSGANTLTIKAGSKLLMFRTD